MVFLTPREFETISLALGLCAHYPRVEISRMDRFRAYLEDSVRGRPPRDLPSRAPIIELQKFAVTREVAREVAGEAVRGPRILYAPYLGPSRPSETRSGINKRDFRPEPRGQFPFCQRPHTSTQSELGI